MRSIICVSLLAGCVTQFKNGTGSVTEDTLDPLENPESNSLLDRMDESYCNNIEVAGVNGSDIAGATSYFWGSFVQESNGVWSGREIWYLHPTDSWLDTNGQTCIVTWELLAEEIGTGLCPDCDFGLSVSGQLNRGSTDCPEGLWEDDTTWEEKYDVKVDAVEASFFYHSSGNELGAGYAEDNTLSFLTEPRCTWF